MQLNCPINCIARVVVGQMCCSQNHLIRKPILRRRTGTREKEMRTISTSEGVGGAQVKIRHDDLMDDTRVQTYRL